MRSSTACDSRTWDYPAVPIGGLVLASLIGSALWEHGRRRLVVAGAVAGLALAAGVWTLRLAVHRGDEHYRVADAMGRRLQTLPADVRGPPGGMSGWSRIAEPAASPTSTVSPTPTRISRRSASAASPHLLHCEGIAGLVEYFDGDPLAGTCRATALPERVHERFRMEFDYVGPLASSGSPRRRVFIYFDYRPARQPGGE